MIGLVLVKEQMLQYVQDMRVVRGMGRKSQIVMLYYIN